MSRSCVFIQNITHPQVVRQHNILRQRRGKDVGSRRHQIEAVRKNRVTPSRSCVCHVLIHEYISSTAWATTPAYWRTMAQCDSWQSPSGRTHHWHIKVSLMNLTTCVTSCLVDVHMSGRVETWVCGVKVKCCWSDKPTRCLRQFLTCASHLCKFTHVYVYICVSLQSLIDSKWRGLVFSSRI